MDTVFDIRGFGDSFVIHYGGRLNEVNAYTFANSLIPFCSALEDINTVLNPGFRLEIAIEALAPGSFRPRIRLRKKQLRDLFSRAKTVSEAVLAGILATMVYERYIADSKPCEITINEENVIIAGNDCKLIMPREVFESRQKIPSDSSVKKKIAGTFKVLEEDDAVESFGITKNTTDQVPDFEIPRADFPRLARVNLEINGENTRIIKKKTQLRIVRAIFERGPRRWQFVWNGIKISAPIRDPDFFSRLANRKITIAQGDGLEVDLLIYQEFDQHAGTYINSSYEVEKVHDHVPAALQKDLI